MVNFKYLKTFNSKCTMDEIDDVSHKMIMKTVQASAFQKLIEGLKDVITDTNITFDDTGMRIMCMDGTHVSLVNLRLYADNFEKYKCDSEIVVGVNMNNFFRLVKSIENNDVLTLSLEKNNDHYLKIHIENNDKHKSTKYQLKLLDLDQQNISVPASDFKTVITLPSSDFQRICRDMLNIGQSIEIRNLGDRITLSCNGDFATQATEIRGLSNENTTIIPDDHKISGNFSLKNLVLFTKCTNLCSTVELYLKNDYPLLIKYQVASLGRLFFCLAPKSTDID